MEFTAPSKSLFKTPSRLTSRIMSFASPLGLVQPSRSSEESKRRPEEPKRSMSTVSTLSAFSPTSDRQELKGADKEADINRILDILEVDLVKVNILPPRRNDMLETLRMHTRRKENSDPLFSNRGITILAGQAFDGASPTTGRVAMRCLGNVMFHSEESRQIFVDLGFAPRVIEKMKDDDREDEMLSSRLLFLCTYGTNLDFEPLCSEKGLTEVINNNISRFAKIYSKPPKKGVPQAVNQACTETLKLLYNLANFYPSQRTALTKSLLPILKMLQLVPLATPPLQAPVNSLIHALIHLDLEDKKGRVFPTNPLFPTFDPKLNVNRLSYLLDKTLSAYSEQELDTVASPLMQVLLRIAEFAPAVVKQQMILTFLPSDSERDRVIGKSDSFASRLLRTSINPQMPNMRNFVPALMFELSGKDAGQFVKNVGYGFASGFLVTQNMGIPSSAMEAFSTGEGDTENVAAQNGELLNIREIKDGEDQLDMDDEDAELFDMNPRRRKSSSTMHASLMGSRRSSAQQGHAGQRAQRKPSDIDENEAKGAQPSSPPIPPKSPNRFLINPVTGQRMDKEPEDTGPPMTEAEKEREAERLFVLFERLKKTGVVDVENPVAKAMREGKLQ